MLLKKRGTQAIAITLFVTSIVGYLIYTGIRDTMTYYLTVPEVLVSGDHERIRLWRLKESVRRTLVNRPDLIEEGCIEGEALDMLKEVRDEGDAGPDGPCDEV